MASLWFAFTAPIYFSCLYPYLNSYLILLLAMGASVCFEPKALTSQEKSNTLSPTVHFAPDFTVSLPVMGVQFAPDFTVHFAPYYSPVRRLAVLVCSSLFSH